MPSGSLTVPFPIKGKPTYGRKSRKKTSKKRVDKKQNQRLKAIESQLKQAEGWLDSSYREATCNRTPQIISSGAQEGQPLSSYFFTNAQATDLADNDHTRNGQAIKALRVKGHITLTGRGSAEGYPPDVGDKTGKNNIRLLGVIYETEEDFTVGLSGVLQNSAGDNAHPSKAIESFYRKQSPTRWKVWLDKVCVVPYTTQTKKVNFNYKVPDAYSKMTYTNNNDGPPITNIMVLYAMTGIRDNGENQMTASATYRCTYVK